LSKNLVRRSGWIVLGLLLLSAAVWLVISRWDAGILVPVSSAIMAQPVGDLPVMPEKPLPDVIGFSGCPPEGKGGDAQLNRLKNRVDKGNYFPVSFDSLTALTWPKSVEQRPMWDWSPSSKAYISRYLGIPIVVEGYIITLREGGPDSASCFKMKDSDPYWRIYFSNHPRNERYQSVIAVSTPQARWGHTWTTDLIRNFIIAGRVRVRLSGWLYFDPYHPQDVGRTRATLWEITPVMQIEAYQEGRWNPLDRYDK
jgi:hypothetical protein